MGPPPKKRKVTQKFKTEYTRTWPSVVQSKTGDGYAFCKTCASDFSVAHGGRDDVRKHVSSKKHQSQTVIQSSVTPVSSYFKEATNTEMQVTNAELLFQKFLIEHNVPLAASDHAGDLFRMMFPDSKLAEKYRCARTKTTAMAKCIGNDISAGIANIMREHPFSIATDGSNDNGSEQLYPVVVRYYNPDIGRIVTELLSICACKEASTGENIFKLLDAELSKWNIPWKNCIAFGSDNAAVMTGNKKGVLAFIKKENENIFMQGCPCHLLHIAARNANEKLSVNVEELLIDIYFYFDKSSKRLHTFQNFQEQAGVLLHKILKHGPTRWLSLSECNARLLEQWPALDAYFKEETTCTDRVSRIKAFFSNPLAKVYCLFLQKSLPLFVNANLFLQKEEPVIHQMQGSMLKLYTDLLARFIKPKVVTACENIFEVEHSVRDNQRHRQDVFVGSETRSLLSEIKSQKKTGQQEESQFYNDVRDFYSTACAYIVKKLPLQDKTMAHFRVLNVKERQSCSFNSVEHFIKKFPSLVTEGDRDTVETEFLSYQIENLPGNILEEGRIDVAWHLIGQLKDVDGNLKYKKLSDLMLGICVIPHSNANSERIFSFVRKTKTEFRASMSTEVLSSIMVQKTAMLARSEVCHKAKFTKDQLAAAKSACHQDLKK